MKWDQDSRSRVKGKTSQISGEFVADEIQVGTREELIGRLQTKYGYSKEKAEAWPVFLVMARRQSTQRGLATQMRSREEKRYSA